MTVYALAVTMLTLSAAVALVCTAVFLTRRDDGLRMRAVMVLNYGVTYIVSGFAHILEISTSTGFYEARTGAMQGDSVGVTVASLATPLGLVFLALGLSVRWARDRRAVRYADLHSVARSHRLLTLVLGLGLTGAAGAAGMVLRSQVLINSAGERIIGVDGGMARYAFLASWLPWGVVLVALALIRRRPGIAAEAWNALVVAGALGTVAVASSWTGGRVDLVVFGVPILVVLLPWLQRAGKPLLLLGAVGVVALVRVQTLGRVGNVGFDLWSLADWQWGRFSMVAWAGTYVEAHGPVLGETLQRGFLIVPLSIVHILGVPTPPIGRSIVELSGISFLGSEEFIHIVPGMSAELYVSFGYVGIAAGYLILGLFCAFLADRYRRAGTELTRVLWAYCAMLAVFQTVNAQSGALTPLILLTGAPLIGLVAVERLMRRWNSRAQRRQRMRESRWARTSRRAPSELRLWSSPADTRTLSGRRSPSGPR